jgi:hypothetical protein
MEVWMGDGWAPYPQVDSVLRHGQRLTEEQAVAALNEARDRVGTLAAFSDKEAHAALRDRLRRA